MTAQIADRPTVQEGIQNQLRGNCGGTGWKYLGGEALGWWEECRGCDACQPKGKPKQ